MILLCFPRAIEISPTWRQVQPGSRCCFWHRYGWPLSQCQRRDNQPDVTLLRTCKQIKQKATKVLYRQNGVIVGYSETTTCEPTEKTSHTNPTNPLISSSGICGALP
ncbi:uncharacterized protein BCR38DRAFT_417996 [Pseudomassariella vexata]|uniref:Uncharacterized protein n=1 Tax=Pseudomassariella vexata TaxID=1141098 RepID=A0A1Y2EKC0_9PEZI|nr:uncharacterized protein BCR38DRAFT_417996 [Pseudomassariella vexata]ORY71766.1 hypothetical protein BCR38DRAFT_417996 [Pseudomassariella vexata]